MKRSPGQRYEAMLRLRTPDGEYIPPFDFLPVARKRGLLRSIDRWVMEHCLARLESERDHGAGRGLRFYVHQTLDSAGANRSSLRTISSLEGRSLS